MRVLVTGGAGYIGSHTLIELLAADHAPLVVDNFANSSPVALERVAQLTNRVFDHVEASTPILPPSARSVMNFSLKP